MNNEEYWLRAWGIIGGSTAYLLMIWSHNEHITILTIMYMCFLMVMAKVNILG